MPASEQQALFTSLVAIAGFVGGLLSTTLINLTASRNKFIDVITAERIKWVVELRRDFATYLAMSLRLASTNKKDESDEYYRLQMELGERISLLDLKLNYESKLDCEISLLARACLHIAMEDPDHKINGMNRSKRLGIAHSNLRILIRMLLKDEWEKAKLESASLWSRRLLQKAAAIRAKQIEAKLAILPGKIPEF